jgi:hypothetical protein
MSVSDSSVNGHVALSITLVAGFVPKANAMGTIPSLQALKLRLIQLVDARAAQSAGGKNRPGKFRQTTHTKFVPRTKDISIKIIL